MPNLTKQSNVFVSNAVYEINVMKMFGVLVANFIISKIYYMKFIILSIQSSLN